MKEKRITDNNKVRQYISDVMSNMCDASCYNLPYDELEDAIFDKFKDLLIDKYKFELLENKLETYDRM